MKIYYSEKHRKHDPPFEVFDGGCARHISKTRTAWTASLSALRGQIGRRSTNRRILDSTRSSMCMTRNIWISSPPAWTEWLASEPGTNPCLCLPPLRLRRHSRKAEVGAGAGGLLHHGLERLHRGRDVSGRAGFGKLRIERGAGCIGRRRVLPSPCAVRPVITQAGITPADTASSTTHRLQRTGCHEGRVAVLDIDYHCGNGTQDIFYSRAM
jgi:hypothetical protein